MAPAAVCEADVPVNNSVSGSRIRYLAMRTLFGLLPIFALLPTLVAD
jgi:hypothetical protein